MPCHNGGEKKPLLLHLLTWMDKYRCTSSAALKERVFTGCHHLGMLCTTFKGGTFTFVAVTLKISLYERCKKNNLL